LGLALPLLLLVRDRRMYFAVAAVGLDLGVYLLLPGRMLEVYVYLAMTGVGIAVAVMAGRYRRVVAVVVMAWAAWQVALDRRQVRVSLAEADERRVFVDLVRRAPDARVYAYADAPGSFGYRGGEYAILLTHGQVDSVYRIEDRATPADRDVELLRFDWKTRRLDARAVRLDRFAYFDRGAELASWQADWAADTEGYRRVRGSEAVRAYHGAGAKEFFFEACGEARATLHAAVEAMHFPDVAFAEGGCATRVEVIGSGAGRVVTIFFSSDGVVKIGGFGFR
jgi:hypothetical protein